MSLLLATFGVTGATYIWTASSPYYFLSTVTATVAALYYIVANLKSLRVQFALLIASSTALLITMIAHLFYFYVGAWMDFPFVRYVAILSILAVTAVAGNMAQRNFDNTLAVVALLHLAIIAHALTTGVYMDEGRFASVEIGTAAWAEIAAGTVVAGVLSRKNWLALLVFAVCAYVTLRTQMRTTGVSMAVVAVFIIFSPIVLGGRQRHRRIAAAAAMVVVLVSLVWIDQMLRIVAGVLLLDDPYRGLDSGFSGRAENVMLGLERVVQSPIVGHGFTDSVVNNTHNGYVLLMAQFGVPFAILMFVLIIVSIKRSFALRDGVLIGCICALCAYYLGQPRAINFQLMPLAGLLAVARGLSFDGELRWFNTAPALRRQLVA